MSGAAAHEALRQAANRWPSEPRVIAELPREVVEEVTVLRDPEAAPMNVSGRRLQLALIVALLTLGLAGLVSFLSGRATG